MHPNFQERPIDERSDPPGNRSRNRVTALPGQAELNNAMESSRGLRTPSKGVAEGREVREFLPEREIESKRSLGHANASKATSRIESENTGR